MNLLTSLQRALAWQGEYRRVRAELETYSQKELNADLNLNRSDIPSLAAEAADLHVARLMPSALGRPSVLAPARPHA